jgi:hypothetical protein
MLSKCRLPVGLTVGLVVSGAHKTSVIASTKSKNK